MWRAIALCALSAPAWGQNATVDELFGEGVFGVKWTDSLEDVAARYPDGRRVRLGETEYWRIRDERTIFEVERRSLDTIEFGFVGGKLTGINVSFRAATGILPALIKFLGTPSEQSVGESVAGAFARVSDFVVLGEWEGTDLKASLTAIGYHHTLTIEPRQLVGVEATRQQLGLE